MISNVDLEKALGKHIGIYPLDPQRIEGASVDLTASRYAWSVTSKTDAVKGDEIVIGPGDTVVVLSNESLSLDSHYAGACYNRISFSMRGLLHASSPIKPNYTGRFSVTLHNTSTESSRIRIGDPVAVVMFHKLDHPSTVTHGNGNGSRLDLLQSMGIIIQDDQKRIEITEGDDRVEMLQRMRESDGFKRIRNRVKRKRLKFAIPAIVLAVAVIIYLLIVILKLDVDVVIQTFSSIIGGLVVGVILLVVEYRRFKE